MSAASPPPRLAERLVSALVGGRPWGEALLGDLAEEHARRARARAGPSADLWYLFEAVRLSLRLAPHAVVEAAGAILKPRRSRPRPKESNMGEFRFDLRLALRALGKRPGVTALLVLTLAVGLGANAAVFGMLDALVLRPFSFTDSDRLVLIWESSDGGSEFDRTSLSPAALLELRRESAGVVDALVGYDWWDANLRSSEGLEKVQGFRTHSELFAALDVRPALGRFFSAAESVAGGARVAVLGFDLWQRQFGGESSILGRSLEIDGTSFTVVGIAPAGFDFPTGAEIWSPLRLTPEQAARRDLHYLGAFGRLAPGVSLATARARFELAGRQMAERYPETYRGRRLETSTLAVGLRDAGMVPIFSLWQAAGFFVLAIGWINVANMVLARGQERQRELALLDALGAGRARLVRLQLTESAVIGLAAAAAALPFAALGQKIMRDTMPAGLRKFVPGWESLGLDLRTIGFTFALAVVSVLAVAAWPALTVSGRKLGSMLREGGRSGASGVRRQRGRAALIVIEIAAALVLVIAAALSVRATQNIVDGPQGYDPNGLVTFKIALPEDRLADPVARRELVRRALDRLGEIPGVDSVAAANVLPATGNNTSRTLALAGEPEPDPAAAPQVDLRTVSDGYFDTLRLPLLAGRLFTAGDDENALPVAIVSRALAERYWPGRDPIGQRLRAGDADQPWLTVVGVAGDHLHHWFSRRNHPTLFVPAAQLPRFGYSFALRTSQEAAALAREVRAAIAAVDAYQPIYELRSQRESIAENTIGLRFVSGVMAVFAALALVLAVSGVYGVMAYRVGLRAHEIGVRVALGATAGDVLRATVGQALRLAGIGLALGLVASLAVGRLLGSVLRGAASFDLPLALGAASLLAVAALGAALVPARRALALDPADVLRSE